MDFETVERFILTFDGAEKSYPFNKSTAVYSVAHSGSVEPEMFALIEEGKLPIRISLKCDPKLSKLLREKYETVMPGNHLNKHLWNTVLLTGQMPWEDIQGLIRLSYNIITGAH